MSRGKRDPGSEVGVVYKRGEKLFLCLGMGKLLQGRDGDLSTCKARQGDVLAKGRSVGDLCEQWGVEPREVDDFVRPYLVRPEPSRRRTSRRRTSAEREHAWQQLRLQRIRVG